MKRWTLVLAGLVAFVVGLVAIVLSEPTSYVYSGREVFFNEEDYQAFKRLLVDHPEVVVEEAQIISSEPPIIVLYELRAPVEVPFSLHYEERIVDDSSTWKWSIPCAILGGLVALASLLAALEGEKNEG